MQAMLHRILRTIVNDRPRQQREDLRENLAEAMQIASNPKALLEEFDALETSWTPPRQTGFEPESDAAEA